jgi:hypothetical protein
MVTMTNAEATTILMSHAGSPNLMNTRRPPMSDATTPAVVQDAQRYDWRVPSRFILPWCPTTHIERLEAERDSASAAANYYMGQMCKEHNEYEKAIRAIEAERDALLAEHEATGDIAYFLRGNPSMVVTLRVEGESGSITLGPVIRRRFLEAYDNAERVLRDADV